MKNIMRKKLNIVILVLALVCVALMTTACNNNEINPYSLENNYQVDQTEFEDALEFAPIGFTPTYGFVLYISPIIDAQKYSYLAEALARQGYLAVIKKSGNSFGDYVVNEPAFLRHQNVRFIVAGHSAGGGVAVRHAMEYGAYGNYIKGVALYSPIGFTRQPSGELEFDDEGNVVLTHYTIAALSIPTLLLGTDDAFSTEAIDIARQHLNLITTKEHILENSNTLAFSTAYEASESEQSVSQREMTVKYTLEFLKSIATA